MLLFDSDSTDYRKQQQKTGGLQVLGSVVECVHVLLNYLLLPAPRKPAGYRAHPRGGGCTGISVNNKKTRVIFHSFAFNLFVDVIQ